MASRFYRVPLVDFGTEGWWVWPERRGVLIGSGCGLMVSVMDQVPFRWCVDTDDLRHSRGANLQGFLHMAQSLTGFVAVCGWFSYSDPEPLRAAVRALPNPAACPVYFGGGVLADVPGACYPLQEFIDRCHEVYSAHDRP